MLRLTDNVPKENVMRIHQCTYTEVGEYLRTSVGIILPTGSTEQHSPMGVLGTDHFCAETISWRVGELASAMVGPSLTVGVSEHHMAFPGSMTIRPSTYIALMRDLILSLVDHGFERFLVINGHGGNTASLNAAFSEVYGEVRRGGGANAPDVRCKTMKWFENPPSEALSLELTGHPAGGHASAAEVSVAQFADPANIKMAKLEPEFATDDHTFYNSADFRRRFADGRIESNPTGSTPEIGRQLVETAALFFAETYRDFLADS
jgi:creatinine amidohydrolase